MNILRASLASGFALVLSIACASGANAQGLAAPTVQNITTNCGGGSVSPAPPGPHYERCGLHLINPNRSDRVVASLRRRALPQGSVVMWDYQWRQTTESFDQEGEVLLRAGQVAPLMPSLVLDWPTQFPTPQIRFQYEVTGFMAPRPDDIDDRPNENVRDYLRIFESRKPWLANYCVVDGVTHPSILYGMVNLHFTRRIAVTYRNRDPRFGGANAEWRTIYLEPSGSDSGGGLGCVVDRQRNMIDIDEVRFVN